MGKVYRVNSAGVTMNMLIFGEPGSGKTSFAASAQDHPAMRDVLFANIEGGMLSVAHRGDIQAVDIASTQEVEDLFWSIVKHKDAGEGEFAEINTVVLDNATELQAMNLDEIVSDAMANPTGKNSGRKNRDDIWRDDYGKSTVQLKRVFRWFRQLPVNMIVTAHKKEVYEKNAKGENVGEEPIAVIPWLTTKLAESLMGYVDFVWHTYQVTGSDDPKDDGFFLLTEPNGAYFAKTRGPNFRRALGGVHRIPEENALPELYDLFLETAKFDRPDLKDKIKTTKKRKVTHG